MTPLPPEYASDPVVRAAYAHYQEFKRAQRLRAGYAHWHAAEACVERVIPRRARSGRWLTDAERLRYAEQMSEDAQAAAWLLALCEVDTITGGTR